ncbi:MFS transporter [Actinomadura sp. WMMB 499]|uniref:MFS transporter n=1 Tax=Actinomadura sp. WMMB 499 TaxID=1219491 RepID=UPI0012483B72|nr:MFS transporter [Actinomadura sp. WMMB 499]QFG23475.1 MFS transporter [Actinomadura sp. WMMB 499]
MDAPERPARAGARAWIGLAVLALPTLLLSIDTTVLFLAMPHLSADLDPGPVQLLWIMDVYGFMIAGFLVTMGALGDRIGRRRLLLYGAAAFGAASALAAYASSPEMLLAARMLLGLSGATLMPSALALISTMFRDERQRTLAIGVFTACFMGGAALGPVVGGTLLENFWWGSVFLIGVPVMVLLLAAAPLLPESRAPGGGRIDLASVALSLAAAFPAVYGLKEIAEDPLRPAAYGVLAAGIAFGYLFVRRQRALADPLLDLRLLRSRTFSAALGILLVTMVVQGGLYLFVSRYLQTIEGLSPLESGLWLALPAIALVAGSLLAPVAARRVRPGLLIAGGMAPAAAGFLVAGFADGIGTLMFGVTLGFLGLAPVGALGIALIVGAAPDERAGAASALAETSGEFGIAFGVASLGSVGAAAYTALVVLPPGTPGAAGDSIEDAVAAAEGLPPEPAAALLAAARDAFLGGFGIVTAVGAALLAGLAVLTVTALRHLPPIGAEATAPDAGAADAGTPDDGAAADDDRAAHR